MKHSEMKWTARDGIEIAAHSWEPEGAIRAAVSLVHGLGEHSGRYAHVGEAFSNAGYALLAADLRGHGLSQGARGHVNSIEDFLQDIDVLLDQTRQRYANVPQFLYGHSLGGILVLHYCLKRTPNVRGVIVTSPALHSALETQTFKVMMANALGSIIPRVAVPSGLDAQAISRDLAIVEKYVNDPLTHDKASMGFGKTMLGVTKWTLQHASEFPLPLLLMHGKADAIAFPSSSIEFAQALGPKVTLRLWEGGYHELHNDLEKAAVIKTMIDWMDARLQAAR